MCRRVPGCLLFPIYCILTGYVSHQLSLNRERAVLYPAPVGSEHKANILIGNGVDSMVLKELWIDAL